MLVKDYDRDLSQPRIIHVLWAAQSGPICAYEDQALAFAHAITMLGVTVSGCELRDELPEVALSDIEAEYANDEPTPVSFEDIDDARDGE
jgi:hypothetical protein